MDFEHRELIIKDMGMCLMCLNPRYTLKTRAERSEHEQNKCSVAKRKRRNRYTCLYEECFLHSWVCTLHRDVNRPLLETHAKGTIKKRQYTAFAHPGISSPGVKHWHSNTPSKKFNIAQHGPNNHTPKPGHNLADILTPECLSPVPTAHQASCFTDGTNDITPDNSLEIPVMLARPENLTIEDVIAIIAAFKRGLLDQWNTHFEEDAPAGLSQLA
jgi:hypothetical protein